VIGPEWGQQHADRAGNYVGSGTNAPRIGRFDMVLLRCCDRLAAKGNKELFLNLQFFNLNFNFLGAAPASASKGSAGSAHNGTDGKAFIQPCLTALMKRWNGYDVNNSDRAEIVPQKAGKDFTGEVLYFLQPFAQTQGAHFRMDVFKSGDGSDRAFMSSDGGTGQLTDGNIAVDNGFGPNSFVAAHELGHGGSLPDEYGEWWWRCSHSGPGLTNNVPGEPFVDDGGGPDIANVAYLGNAPAAGNVSYGMMSMAADMRNRYFWHNAEFARKHVETPFFAKLGAYDQYKVPLNSKYPYRTYAYWPVRKKVGRKGGKHGLTDIYLHVYGKDLFSQTRMPGGAHDGMVSVFIKIDMDVAGTLNPAWFRDQIRNAILSFNYTYTASGTTGVRVDGSILREDWAFNKAAVRFSPRFLIKQSDGTNSWPFNNYATNYTYWQGHVGSHFQITVVDNTGVAAAKQTKSGFTAKRGGAIQLGYDTGDPAAQANLQTEIQALLPDMLGVKVKGGVIVAKDLNPLAASVIHSGAKVT
jgi:hypothetical protein